MKTGGRKEGTPNKRSQAVHDQLMELGCDPIAGLANLVQGGHPCPECHGAKVQKYIVHTSGQFDSGTYEVNPDHGDEQTCLMCHGSGCEPVPAKLASEVFGHLAQYFAPRLKAIDHSGNIGGTPKLEVFLSMPPVEPAAIDAAAPTPPADPTPA